MSLSCGNCGSYRGGVYVLVCSDSNELSVRLFQVFIAVQNENDNTPLTVEPVYYPSIPENSPAGKVVVELKAEDHDLDPSQRLAFRITAGNPGGFFSINSDTGER
jgi:protocadherin Fat 1/2/3